ncbi:MAG: nucleotidyltransferase family protein [candidate division NC10 bacterium]|nr:nucleotidyltransferase family protein [candidate division NC10 bacterium]
MSPADLRQVLELAHAHNVLAVILPALRQSRPALPGDLQISLAESEVAFAAQALYRENGLKTVLHLLDAAGVEVVVLKGAFLASCVYGDFAQRPMNDFDLFVRREDLPRAAAALQQAGYRCEDDWPDQGDPGGASEFRSLSGQAIELRYDLTQGTRLRGVVNFPEAEMWQRRRTFETLAGGTLLSLDPTDHLLYLTYHAGILHLFAALIWLVDVDRFIRKFQGEIAWDDLPTRARRIGCATCLWHGLGLAKELLGTSVEEAVLHALRPGTLRAGLVQRWLTPQTLLRGMTPPEQPRMQALQKLLLDTAGADIRSLWQGLFPPRQWLQWRYRTSNPVTLRLLRTLYPFGGWARPRT